MSESPSVGFGLAVAHLADPAQPIIDLSLTDNRVMMHLKELCYNVGARPTGSPELQKAEKWALAKFKSFGYANAHLEKWADVPVGFQRGPNNEARMVSPSQMEMKFSTNCWMPGTKGPQRGKGVLAPKTMEELAAVKDSLKGAWVLSDACPEKLPVMFLSGEIYIDMSKEEIRTHASVKTAVAGAMFNLNREVDWGDLFINGVLVTNVGADVSNNPDMLAVFWESLEKNLVHYVTHDKRDVEILGSPDWALEIVSNSSVKKDYEQLRHAYHRAGIREYWIIDARGDDIRFLILHWRKSGYAAAAQHDGWVRSRVFQREFRLTRKRDRRGAWKYTLDVR